MKIVLDSSAFLAVLLNEPGRDRLLEADADFLMSAVNLEEVRSKLFDKGNSHEEVEVLTNTLSAVVVDFSGEQANISSSLRNATRKRGLSLGDRACLSLAAHTGAKVMTADRNWADLELPVNVEVIR